MKETSEKTGNPLDVVGERTSRRSLLKGAVAGAAGVSGLVAGAGFLTTLQPHAAFAKAASLSCGDTEQSIINTAATAEELAVVFYYHGVKNAAKLGISGQNLSYLQAALVEEQLHLNYLLSAGAVPLTSTFSFPHGWNTFENQGTFINTLQQLETDFESAYLAAVKEFGELGLFDLAVVAGQIATIEAEHRALGRSIIMTKQAANNWGFTPVYVTSVGDAVTVLTDEGYLSPTSNNTFTYTAVSTNSDLVTQTTPYSVETC